MIDAAIVGLGRWGRTLVGSVQGKSEKLRFTRTVSRDPDRVRDIAARLGLGVVGEGSVLGDRTIDAVVLATPHLLHCEQVIAAARAGKVVFCEKPLTPTKTDAARSTRAERLASHKGWHRQALLSGATRAAAAGQGRRARQSSSSRGHFRNEVAGTASEWRYSLEESPAGGMTGTGIHMLDALVALAGPVRRVQALLLSHKPPPDPHDSLSALLEFASGVSGTLAMVRSSPAYFRLHASLAAMPRTRPLAGPSW